MRWEKKGILLPAPPPVDWATSHLMVPVADVQDGELTVYFGARDAEGRSRIGRARVDLDSGSAEYDPEPVLHLGELGAFDDSGVTPSCIVRSGQRTFLYYIGWRRGVTVPFYTAVGCAVSERRSDPFRRVSLGPLLPADDVDPLFTTSPWVVVDEGRWRMWYTSGVRWEDATPTPTHRYHIRYAESADGLVWSRSGHVCIDFASPDEYAIARPCVVRDGELYRMWFSHRGSRYRIGYAESIDGLDWRRRPGPLELDVSPGGWDGEMVEYPCVVDIDGRRYLLYNGDGFGRTGVGWAELAE